LVFSFAHALPEVARGRSHGAWCFALESLHQTLEGLALCLDVSIDIEARKNLSRYHFRHVHCMWLPRALNLQDVDARNRSDDLGGAVSTAVANNQDEIVPCLRCTGESWQ
jgi:hypothetical protein